MKYPLALATMIGSLPHGDANSAIDKILQYAPEAPVWPQLPMRDWREGFLPQYAEGLPGLVKDADNAKVSINTDHQNITEDLAAFYESSMMAVDSNDFSRFLITKEASEGFYTALERFKALETKPPFVKVHTTGPVSFALTVFDQNDRALFYDETFNDVALQSCIMKSIWQIREYKDLADNIICFLDEPVLSAFGSSAYVNVSREEVVRMLKTAIDAIHNEGALVGVHVCGNSEWTILIDAGVDLINFDAYFHGEGIALYADQIKSYLESGGALAWGIIPTSAEIHNVTPESLYTRLEEVVKNLASQGVDEDLIWAQSVLTPSCGMGTMTLQESELVMQRLSELSKLVRKNLE